MYFRHSPDIWSDFPALVPGALAVTAIHRNAAVDARIAAFNNLAQEQLATSSESGFPEIQAWRRAFAQMGHKPTQYRSASESLLRRFRKEGSLPRIHPLIDLCNAISLAFAIPVAALDVDRIADWVEVRYATGGESYASFSGDTEHPDAREVIFADSAGQAHARRWTNRQSALSAVRDTTSSVLIVAEALHESAPADIERLVATIAEEIATIWLVAPKTAILTRSTPQFEF
jgi:DNA/RNA-binding domain of Phe-tRNA-synthetase-like protein